MGASGGSALGGSSYGGASGGGGGGFGGLGGIGLMGLGAGGGGKGGSPSIGKPPKTGKSYAQGIQQYLKFQPQLLAGEMAARTNPQYGDAARIQEQQGLQAQLGPTQYSQQLGALNQLDPAWVAAHGAYGSSVVNPLLQMQQGNPLMTPSMRTQLQQSVRGAQSARGNILGPGAGVEEAYALGDREHQLEQEAIRNAGIFNASPQESNMVAGIAPVAPDRSSAYVDPNAGFQWVNAANQRYATQAALAGAGITPGGNSGNPWGSALSGAGTGAMLGSEILPGYGTAIGAIAGGLYGGLSNI